MSDLSAAAPHARRKHLITDLSSFVRDARATPLAAASWETCGSPLTLQTIAQDWPQMFVWCKSEQIRRCWWTLAALFARLGANMFNVLVGRYLFSCCKFIYINRETTQRRLQLKHRQGEPVSIRLRIWSGWLLIGSIPLIYFVCFKACRLGF